MPDLLAGLERFIHDPSQASPPLVKASTSPPLMEDEVRFYDALASNESAVREPTGETIKKIAMN